MAQNQVVLWSWKLTLAATQYRPSFILQCSSRPLGVFSLDYYDLNKFLIYKISGLWHSVIVTRSTKKQKPGSFKEGFKWNQLNSYFAPGSLSLKNYEKINVYWSKFPSLWYSVDRKQERLRHIVQGSLSSCLVRPTRVPKTANLDCRPQPGVLLSLYFVEDFSFAWLTAAMIVSQVSSLLQVLSISFWWKGQAMT